MNAAPFVRLLAFCLMASPALAQPGDLPPPDAPLPEGFPDPTVPGEIEIKQYPAYRSAWTKGDAMSMRSGDMLFFWLFRHISERKVEMTAPVINTYLDPEIAVDPSLRGDLSMEFLYERPDQGEAGKGVGPVEVKDFAPMTVVALGFQGVMTPEEMADGVKRLQTWIKEHGEEWTEAGPPRRLGYHGPMTPADRQLWEVQIPVKPVGEAPQAEDNAEPGDEKSETPENPESSR
ncbi:heme-binding protein [Tautonia marina]|uniref:heme-binding protein n=1 Tax=Tautonia marina TaxID=2653855 RepID=UPI0012606A4E|nr:heme-binding protein [Tautonia marina]